MPVRGLNQNVAIALLLLSASTATWAEPPVIRLGPEVRSSTPAPSGVDEVFIYPPGCYDRAGRPINVDPANPGRSADAACQPPSGTVVQGRRGPDGPIAPGETHMERGSVNRPPLPVPVNDGYGVIR